MAGFLDAKERIIDMVLTGEGKYLLSRGELNFVYWAAFDDEVDYDPYISNSASLSAAQISSSIAVLIEDTPLREVTTGYTRFNKSGSDNTNVNRPLYKMPQGQSVLPTFFTHGEATSSLSARQYIKYENEGTISNIKISDTSKSTLQFGYTKDSFPPEYQYEGILLRVYRSGSEGWIELGQQFDSNSNICFGKEIKVQSEK
jgi:hypothetical protein